MHHLSESLNLRVDASQHLQHYLQVLLAAELVLMLANVLGSYASVCTCVCAYAGLLAALQRDWHLLLLLCSGRLLVCGRLCRASNPHCTVGCFKRMQQSMGLLTFHSASVQWWSPLQEDRGSGVPRLLQRSTAAAASEAEAQAAPSTSTL